MGAILSAAAPAFPVFILGKMLYGLGIGFALHAAPAYLAEVGHPRIRGLLIRQALSVCQAASAILQYAPLSMLYRYLSFTSIVLCCSNALHSNH